MLCKISRVKFSPLLNLKTTGWIYVVMLLLNNGIPPNTPRNLQVYHCFDLPTFSAPPPCVDTLENCDRYPRSVCSDPKYAPWANANCRYYCRQCTRECNQ